MKLGLFIFAVGCLSATASPVPDKRFFLDTVKADLLTLQQHVQTEGALTGALNGLKEVVQHHADQVKQTVQTAAGLVDQAVHQNKKRFLLDDLKADLQHLTETYQSGGLAGALSGVKDVVQLHADQVKQAVQTAAGLVDQAVHQNKKRFLLDDLKADLQHLTETYQSGGLAGALSGVKDVVQLHADQVKQAVQTAAGLVDQAVHQNKKRFLLDDLKADLQHLTETYQSGGLAGALSGVKDVVQLHADQVKQAVQTAAGLVDQAVHQQ